MSCVFTRPSLPHGKLPATDWAYDGVADYAFWDNWATSDIVDADVIQRNWSILFSHVNGELNGSDMDVDTASAVNESTILAAWAEDTTWPIQNHRHSHNGMDSAVLADDVVTHTNLGSTAQLMLRHPSKSFTALALFGRAFSIERAWLPYASLAIPYEYRKWGTGFVTEIYRDGVAGGRTHFLASSYKPNWNTYTVAQKRAFAVPYIEVTVSSNKITEFEVHNGRLLLEGLSTTAVVNSDVVWHWLGVYTL